LPYMVHLSVGWPSRGGTAKRNRSIGQCFDGRISEDGFPHVFISPTLPETKPERILDVLLHELVHAAVGCEAGHRGEFKACAQVLGLVGSMTATTAGAELTERLERLATVLGAFPHAEIQIGKGRVNDPTKPAGPDSGEGPDDPKGDSGPRKQGTRMIKLTCGNSECPTMDEKTGAVYTVRTTRKWLEVGVPSCPCGAPMTERL